MRLEQDYDINLLTPLQGTRGHPLSSLNALYLLVVCLVVLGWTGTWGWYALRERDQQLEMASLREQVSQLVEPGMAGQVDILRKTVTQKEADVRAIQSNLIPYSEILAQLDNAVPEETSLAEISVTGDQMVCKGVTANYLTLARFISSVSQQKQLNESRCIMAEPVESAVRFELQIRISH
ncbi:MAG: PilN domain-containing protein [Bacillota bacterium]